MDPSRALIGRSPKIMVLRDQVRALETERDQARHGITVLERALRRQGCCDSNGAEPL